MMVHSMMMMITHQGRKDEENNSKICKGKGRDNDALVAVKQCAARF